MSSWPSVSMRSEPVAPSSLDLFARQSLSRNHTGADRVVDVVVEVGDAIDQTDDLSLERRGLGRTRVVEDPRRALLR